MVVIRASAFEELLCNRNVINHNGNSTVTLQASSVAGGKKDRLFLFLLCKTCMEISTVPLAIPKRIVQPAKFELVG